MKRFLKALPMLTIMLFLLTSRSYAAATVKIGKAEYDDLNTAISAVQDGQTIDVLQDLATYTPIVVTRDITIDFHNHKLINSPSPQYAPCTFQIAQSHLSYGKLALKNADIRAERELASIESFCCLTLESGSYTSRSGIYIDSDGTLEITGGFHSLSGSGSLFNETLIYSFYGNVIITSGVLQCRKDILNLIHSVEGHLQINGGKINCHAKEAIYLYHGDLQITNGTIKTKRGKKEAVPVKAKYAQVNISGGRFESSVGLSLDSWYGKTIVSGGTFRSICNYGGKASFKGGTLTEYIISDKKAKTVIHNVTIKQRKKVYKPMLNADRGSTVQVKGGKYISKKGYGYSEKQGGKVKISSKASFKVKRLSVR